MKEYQEIIIRAVNYIFIIYLIIKDYNINIILLFYIIELHLGSYKNKNFFIWLILINFFVFWCFKFSILQYVIAKFLREHVRGECAEEEKKDSNYKDFKQSTYKSHYQNNYWNKAGYTKKKDSYDFCESYSKKTNSSGSDSKPTYTAKNFREEKTDYGYKKDPKTSFTIDEMHSLAWTSTAAATAAKLKGASAGKVVGAGVIGGVVGMGTEYAAHTTARIHKSWIEK